MFPITITLHNEGQLNAVLRALGPEPEVQEVKPAPKAEKPKAEKPKAEPKPAEAPAPAAEPSAPAPAPAPAASSIDYAVLQRAVFKLAGLSREATMALAKGMGVNTFKELPAERWAEALAAVEAKTAELEAA